MNSKGHIIDRIGTWARRWQGSVDEPPHANYDAEIEHAEEMLAQYCIEFLAARGFFPLPTQGRTEREHLYKWIVDEEVYVKSKFDDAARGEQRSSHDDTLRNYDMTAFWTRQIVQYLDRADAFLKGAKEKRAESDGTGVGTDLYVQERARALEMKAQQAIAKAMMTAKGCAESAIRVFGNMPQPGVESGEVREWE